MTVTRESLIQEARLCLDMAIEQRSAKDIKAASELLLKLDSDTTGQDLRAITVLAQLNAVPTALYRHFNSEGVLLYIGVSMTITGRMARHETDAVWFREIDHIKLQWFGSRSAALMAEEHAIKTEKPLYNVVFNEGKTHDLEKRAPRAVRSEPRKRQNAQ
jgi:predicted GIY-YIG superfamily endonuclease